MYIHGFIYVCKISLAVLKEEDATRKRKEEKNQPKLSPTKFFGTHTLTNIIHRILLNGVVCMLYSGLILPYSNLPLVLGVHC